MIDQLASDLAREVQKHLPDALGQLDYAPDALDKVSGLEKLAAKVPGAIVIIITGLLLLAFAKLVLRLHRKYQASRLTNPEDIRRLETVSRVTRYALSALINIAMVLMVFDQLGIALTPLLGAAGIVGIAVGFGAQSLVKDYTTGLFLIIENQIRQGDVIEVATKSGVVEEVTLRYVRLRDYEGNVHFVPNSLITAVTNKSRGFAFAVMEAAIKHDQKIDVCLRLMREIGAELREDPVFAPKIIEDIEITGVDRWADSHVVLRCRCKTLPLEQWKVKNEFLRRLKMAFDAANIEATPAPVEVPATAPANAA